MKDEPRDKRRHNRSSSAGIQGPQRDTKNLRRMAAGSASSAQDAHVTSDTPSAITACGDLAADELPRLEVYKKKAILFEEGLEPTVFTEGPPDATAIARGNVIRTALKDGYLTQCIKEASSLKREPVDLVKEHKRLIRSLVASITSDSGRGVVALTILQLAVKAIAPEQDIRLHKAGKRAGEFSWTNGLSMRRLDDQWITPALRDAGLLSLNKSGFMMTRTLAENYPYSRLYKAVLRSGGSEWLEVVGLAERNLLPSRTALVYLLHLLHTRKAAFDEQVSKTLLQLDVTQNKLTDLDEAIRFVTEFFDLAKKNRPRLLEVAMHALLQVLEDIDVFEGVLKPLGQMRQANKKHGNIGDVEITTTIGSQKILEAWDAKYGKSHLYDELAELTEKLETHPETERVGFVTSGKPDLTDDIKDRLNEITSDHSVEVVIMSFAEWAALQVARVEGKKDVEAVPAKWLLALGESLCQKRRDRAPIDEPCDQWITDLEIHARNWAGSQQQSGGD